MKITDEQYELMALMWGYPNQELLNLDLLFSECKGPPTEREVIALCNKLFGDRSRRDAAQTIYIEYCRWYMAQQVTQCVTHD